MIELDTTDIDVRLAALLKICDETPTLAEMVAPETLGHAIQAAMANVYDTVPGAYDRSLELLRGLHVKSRGARNRATVTVSNEAPHAIYVELGRSGMTPETLFALAAARGVPTRPLTLGRSGQNWRVAGPILTPAAVFAAWRMRELFARRVRAIIR